MATDTQKLLQENPSKTLGANPLADSNASLKNRFQDYAPNTTTPLSSIDNPVSYVPSKELDESMVGGSTSVAALVASSPTNTATILDIQKKIHQAGWFRILMQLSEQKKNQFPSWEVWHWAHGAWIKEIFWHWLTPIRGYFPTIYIRFWWKFPSEPPCMHFPYPCALKKELQYSIEGMDCHINKI